MPAAAAAAPNVLPSIRFSLNRRTCASVTNRPPRGKQSVSTPCRPVSGPANLIVVGRQIQLPLITRALVVDDEADARELMRYELETRGAHVSVATTMLEALDLLGRETFDVLIADLGMPEQDGFALIRAIRALPEPRGGRIPAIAVTAYASLRDRDRALTAGYNCHLAKPVDPDALIEAVVAASGLQSKT
jgi:CheY-like chemotaxis protein